MTIINEGNQSRIKIQKMSIENEGQWDIGQKDKIM